MKNYLLSILFIFLSGCAALKTKGDPSYLSVMTDLYRVPLNHLHSVRRGECPMYPSCSEFAKQSIKEYGVEGIIIVSERLMRCGRDTIDKLGKVHVDGDIKTLDPVPSKFSVTSKLIVK